MCGRHPFVISIGASPFPCPIAMGPPPDAVPEAARLVRPTPGSAQCAQWVACRVLQPLSPVAKVPTKCRKQKWRNCVA